VTDLWPALPKLPDSHLIVGRRVHSIEVDEDMDDEKPRSHHKPPKEEPVLRPTALELERTVMGLLRAGASATVQGFTAKLNVDFQAMKAVIDALKAKGVVKCKQGGYLRLSENTPELPPPQQEEPPMPRKKKDVPTEPKPTKVKRRYRKRDDPRADAQRFGIWDNGAVHIDVPGCKGTLTAEEAADLIAFIERIRGKS
jgi:hypothetical protein